MKYLVTGGAGFIGSHLVEQLAGAGHDVVVLDNFSTGHRDNVRPFLDSISLVEGSTNDPHACAAAAEGADVIFHEAALGSVPRSVADPTATHENNLTGTLNVLLAAREAGVKRVVYASSSSAYGNTEELPKHESMPPLPLSPYAVSKLGGEQYCRAFHSTYGLETVSLRYFNVFGPRQDPGSQYAAVIPKFTTAALRGESPAIHGDGEQTRDFTYVANVVRANLLAAEAPAEALGHTFNVGCGDRISINRLWTIIQGLTGTPAQATHGPARPGDVRDSLASLERARAVLGYSPPVSLEEGLARTVAHYRESHEASVPLVAND